MYMYVYDYLCKECVCLYIYMDYVCINVYVCAYVFVQLEKCIRVFHKYVKICINVYVYIVFMYL